MSSVSVDNQTPSKRVSRSRTITKKGTQGLTSRDNNATERALVPTSTLRALQLRDGKGGSFGTGDVMRISGREKLELIAEDEMDKAREERRNLYEANMNSSLKAPFQLESILKVAQSQMDAYIDLINALRNPELCYDIVLRETEAHSPPKRDGEESDRKRVPSFVAQQFGICAHNAYMLASGWVILYECFLKLQEKGVTDKNVYAQLKSDGEIHDIYLSAYRLLKKLVSALQQKLRSIVQNTPHYAPYFRSSSESANLQEFERSEIKRMYKSFLDSAVIELCLPGSKFSPQALYFCLHATQEETPKLLKRCPQLMWDVIGDLAEAVRLLDIMETPLLNHGSVGENEEDSTVLGDFVWWDEAQAKSVQAAMQYSSFVNLVHPLSNLMNKATLNKTWDRLNRNYVREAGQDIDALWQLVDARHRIPHFSTLDVSADKSKSRGKELVLARHNGKRKPRRVVNGSDSEDLYADMPDLAEVSNSEDDYGRNDSDDEDSSDDEYDEDDEEELKRQQREAIDRSLENPDVLNLNNDKYMEERRKNPLLSLLGNLRGRLFSSTAILRTDGETTAPSKPSTSSAVRKSSAKLSTVPKLGKYEPGTTPSQDAPPKTTVEDSDNESDGLRVETAKKKKHKKKKKKKTNGVDGKSPTSEVTISPITEPPKSPSPPPESQVTPSVLPASPKAEEQPNPRTRPTKIQSPIVSGAAAFASTTTLPLPHEEKAPSAHSYLKKELPETKTKVKTRREVAPSGAEPDNREGRSLFDRFRGKDRDVQRKEEEKQESDLSFFGRLKKKTLGNFQKLIGVSAQDRKGSLKWDQFVQVMCELGFDYDPSTAGSSVRFDPPNRNVRSITFHKPHPDPTLHQHILKEYRAKLESYYGWSPEVFKKAVDGLETASDNKND